MTNWIAAAIILCIPATALASWSMVVIPDTQNYTINYPARMPAFHSQTQWTASTAAQYNTQFLLGVGDITVRNDEWPMGSTYSEWEEAVGVMDTLVTAGIPYILPTGNHDYTPVSSAPLDHHRDTTKFNDYFGHATFPGMVPMDPGEYQNNYTAFTAPDGRELLILSLEVAPRSFVLDWATTVAAQYPDLTVIVSTHINIEEGDFDPAVDQVIQRDPKGDILWEWARTIPNLELIFNGHELDGDDLDTDGVDIFAARLESTGDLGQTIHEIGFNTQDVFPGGGGWLRLYTFLDDGITLQAQTYSPYLDLWMTDPRNSFNVQLTPIGVADQDGDGDVDGADFLTWQRSFGSVADLAAWELQYVTAVQLSAAAMPEPNMLVLASIGISGLLAQRRQTRAKN